MHDDGGHWAAGSEREAVEGGMIDGLFGGARRPPTDFPDAYHWAYDQALEQRSNHSWQGALGEDTLDDEQRAALGLMHLAIYTDGRVDPREIAWIYEEARTHAIFAGISERGFRSARMSILQDLREISMLALFKSWAEAARQRYAREAFELAVGVVLADGKVVREEEGLVLQLMSHLGLPRQEASRILNLACERRSKS